eukprot:Gregarina_sp_Poly_1__2113@NODE_155_length_12405_cov_134_674339_g137_i0_p8_GENE_NODE_155_length_12405_cov_134_674339_g137_i0NODE_155_length_12405_cov_134_674339_g137_i0_p8_ORF_typecomplete_len126_score10_38_NODE_155_length_12405_cov_134_674339_g137_i01168612063
MFSECQLAAPLVLIAKLRVARCGSTVQRRNSHCQGLMLGNERVWFSRHGVCHGVWPAALEVQHYRMQDSTRKNFASPLGLLRRRTPFCPLFPIFLLRRLVEITGWPAEPKRLESPESMEFAMVRL